MKRGAVVPVLVSLGCNFEYSFVEPSGIVEEMLISETARFAGILGVQVRGEITDKLAPNQISAVVTPLSWYDEGIAYYYRPMLHRVSLTPEAGKETATNIAAHEVCHSKHFLHDISHWLCSDDLATPTYARPGGQ